MRRKLFAIRGMFMLIRIMEESASRIKSETRHRYLIDNRIYFQQYDLCLRPDKPVEHPAAISLASHLRIDSQMFYIQIGIEFSIGYKADKSLIFRKGKKPVFIISESLHLLLFGTLFEQRKTYFIQFLKTFV